MKKKKTVLTQGGYQRLKEKLAALLKERKQLVVELEETRKLGDLAENSAYHELKNQLEILQNQINETEEILKNAQVLEKEDKENGRVGLGSTVKLVVNGREREFTIVSDGETDPLKGKISFSSPLAQALKGKREGEEVVVETPEGKVVYRILAITNN